MASKKDKRQVEVRAKKQKKTMKRSIFVLIMTCLVGFLVFMFLTLFDYVYPPVDGRGTARKREKQPVVLFFSDGNERFLVAEQRLVPKEDRVAEQVQELVQALVGGPKTGLTKTFPEKAEVRHVRVEQEIAYIDFNDHLVSDHPGGSASEMATVYSLANSVVENVPSVKRVKILVNGKDIPSLRGHVDIRRPIAPNRDLIVQATKKG